MVVRELAPLTGERLENGHWLMRGWETEMQRNVLSKETKLARLRSLHHHGMVQSYSTIQENGTLYVLQEPEDGITLPGLWENRTYTPDDVWSPEELVRAAAPAVEALIALAKENLLEPLKPENFMMVNGSRICLTDIGTTYGTDKMDFHSDTTTAFPPQASMWYMAPELMKTDYDAEKAAQYTLCAILYRMMSTAEVPSWVKRASRATRRCAEWASPPRSMR